MDYVLQNHARSFATRGRAREIVADIVGRSNGSRTVTFDFTSVQASPAFLAELLGSLAHEGMVVTITGADEYLTDTLGVLLKQLGLSEIVVVRNSALAV